MNSGLLMGALALISALTGLTVEGLKKILDEKGKTYSSTLLAVYVSFGITVFGSILYMVYRSVPFTAQTFVIIVALTFLSFLCATTGYDKVIKVLGGNADDKSE